MRTAFVVLALLLIVACGRTPTAPTQSSAPAASATPKAIQITGPTRPSPGSTPVLYSATAEFADGTTQDITAAAQWSFEGFTHRFSAPGAVALSGRGPGTISAKYQGVTGLLKVSVLETGTFILSGVVNESNSGSLDWVTVDVVSGTGAGISVSNDITGRYAIFGVAGAVQIRASRNGYATETRDLVITADTTTEPFSLRQVVPSSDLAGPWTMTVAPGAGCSAGLPDIARGRTYTVQFLGQPSSFFVKTSGPTLEVYNVATDPGSLAGSAIQWTFIGDTNYGDWSWANIIDHISGTENFQFDGAVSGTVNGNEIRATLKGDLGYWNYQVRSDKPAWYCRASDHVVLLKR